MSILGFEYFLVVAEELNFTKAAARLYISQQSLSAHIQRLEDQYKVTLFQRKPFLKLTPAGEAMVFYAKQMLRAEGSMVSQFADINKKCRGHLNIGMSRQRVQIFFENIWDRYHSENDNIVISISEKNTDTLLEQLRNGQIDLCVGINVTPTKDISVDTLFTEHLCCSISTSLLKRLRPNTWNKDKITFLKSGVDLLTITDLPFLMLSSQNRIRTIIDRIFRDNAVYPDTILETNTHELLIKLSNSGVGIISPMYLYEYWQFLPVSQEIPPIYPISSSLTHNTLDIVTRANEPLPSYVKNMKSVIIEEFLNYKHTVNKLTTFHLIE